MTAPRQPSPPNAPGLRLRLEAARAAGCEVRDLDPATGYLFEIRRGGRRRVLLGGLSPLNDAAASAVANDKFHCATVLADAGMRVPRHARCLRPGRFADDDFAGHTGFSELRSFIREVGLPVVVKPGHGARGRDVSAVRSEAELEAAIERIWRSDHLAVIEAVVPGIDLRIDLLDGACLIAYLRRPLADAGDGIVLNLNRQARAELVAPLPAAWLAYACRIGRSLRLRHLGIDLKIAALDVDPEAATVIEVNASPSMEQIALRGHHALALEGERAVIEAILSGD